MSAVCEAKFDSESVPDARVTLIGTGISDYLDPLFAPGCAGEISGRVSEELRRRRDWDFCDWQDLSEGAPLAGLGSVEKETPCSAIAMQATFEKYMAAREGALRRNLRRAKAKAEEAGSVVFEVSDSAGAELMDALVRLHGTRWGEVGETGMIVANGSEAFLQEASAAFARNGQLQIFSLQFDRQLVAVILAFCDQTTVYGYLSAFDPE